MILCHSIATKFSFLTTPKLSGLALCISGEILKNIKKSVSKFQVLKHQTTVIVGTSIIVLLVYHNTQSSCSSNGYTNLDISLIWWRYFPVYCWSNFRSHSKRSEFNLVVKDQLQIFRWWIICGSFLFFAICLVFA